MSHIITTYTVLVEIQSYATLYRLSLIGNYFVHSILSCIFDCIEALPHMAFQMLYALNYCRHGSARTLLLYVKPVYMYTMKCRL